MATPGATESDPGGPSSIERRVLGLGAQIEWEEDRQHGTAP